MKRNEWYSAIYREIQRLQADHKLPDRTYSAMMDGAVGHRIRAGIYREEHQISDVVASRDLRKLTDLALLIPHGERRGRYYTGAQILTDIAYKLKVRGKAENPYDLVRERKNKMQTEVDL